MTRAAPVRRRPWLKRRVAALLRLLSRRRRAALRPSDHAAPGEFELIERHPSAVARSTDVAAIRRRTELDYLLSASSRFVVRGVDTAL
jgi:hypothetical protein